MDVMKMERIWSKNNFKKALGFKEKFKNVWFDGHDIIVEVENNE